MKYGHGKCKRGEGGCKKNEECADWIGPKGSKDSLECVHIPKLGKSLCCYKITDKKNKSQCIEVFKDLMRRNNI